MGILDSLLFEDGEKADSKFGFPVLDTLDSLTKPEESDTNSFSEALSRASFVGDGSDL
jgi:hypothetical protein